MMMHRYRASFPTTLLAATIMVAATATAASAKDDVGASKSELIRSLLPTVVNISVAKEETSTINTAMVGAVMPGPDTSQTTKTYVGSGFVIDPSGLIVTNYHVVGDAFEIIVTFSDGTRLPGKVTSASRVIDLALVKVEASHALAVAHWGDSELLQVGDQVFAAGDPFGIGLSLSTGIVSGLNRDIQESPFDDFIQTDAPINHGNSGGPLFDLHGNVVGVNSTIISPTSGSTGLGFAIPSSIAHFVVDQLRTYGWARPGWIGVSVQPMTQEIADAIGMVRPEGSIISSVLPDGPAKKAGLAIGDVILRDDAGTPTDERALLRDIARTPPGNTITLAVLRGGEERTVPIPVEAAPRSPRDVPTMGQRPKVVIPPDLGLSLSALDRHEGSKSVADVALKPTSGVQSALKGVLVTGVVANSDSARRGMAIGDLILRVQDLPATSPEDVLSGINAARVSKREFVVMLVLPKVRKVPGPKWVALQLENAGG